MQKYLLIIAAWLLTSAHAWAQTAQDILNETAQRFQKSSGTVVAFTAAGGMEGAQAVMGTITLKGEQFALKTNVIQAWFDGTTLWTIYQGSNEVNVSHPTPEEIQAMNPMYFMTLYQKGYALNMKNTTHSGRGAHEVKMTAQSKKASVQELIVCIDKSQKRPYYVKLRKGKQWMNIDINSYRENQKVAQDAFVFNPKNYPDFEVIDLR